MVLMKWNVTVSLQHSDSIFATSTIYPISDFWVEKCEDSDAWLKFFIISQDFQIKETEKQKRLFFALLLQLHKMVQKPRDEHS